MAHTRRVEDLGRHRLIERSIMARVPYQNPKAIAYAKQYCGTEDNSCGTYLKGGSLSDCAHFIAHCLAAGGIKVMNTDPATALCGHGLAVRNPVIVAELDRLAGLYENVKPIDLSDAIVGDIGFLNLERPRHAFMISRPGPYPGKLNVPFAWAHSNSRCDEQLDTDFWQWLANAYRLEDG
jgi:hypothetical protein